MRIPKIFYLFFLITAALIFYSCNKEPMPVATNTDNISLQKRPAISSNVTIFATGLNNPRGLKFGPDGFLYVAEGGRGGNLTTTGLCDSVIPPIGPYVGGFTARILKFDSNGGMTVVADELPSSTAAVGFTSGVADVAFVGNTLYALLSGAGCSHGIANTPNSVIKVNNDGSWNVVADLSAFQQSHPVAHPEPDDFEPDGTWYSMVSVRGDLYAVEPNHGELDKITVNGDISRVLDFSSVYGHIVPTSLTYNGNFFVGNLNTFPTVAGSSNIFKVTPSGQSMIWAKGFSEVLGLVIDKNDRMFVLESSAVDGGPTPKTGRITEVDPSGKRQVLVDTLFFPTGMTMGPDGALYVSNQGFGPPIPGFGQILRIDVNGIKNLAKKD